MYVQLVHQFPKRHAEASCIFTVRTYQEDDFENTSCNNSIVCMCRLNSISHCNHFGVQDYSQEGQEDHLDNDHLINAFGQGFYSAKIHGDS